MPKFKTVSGVDVASLKMTAGSKRRVHFFEEQKASETTVTSSGDAIARVGKPILFDGPKGIWSIDITGVAKGAATVTATRKNGGSAALAVTVEDPLPLLKLPAENEETGLIARLLLAEVRTPSHPSYDAGVAKTTMEWMRIVLQNRLKTPDRFGAKGATSISEIVKAKGQFAGFENYPKLAAGVKATVAAILAKANDRNDPNQAAFHQHVQNAIDVAQLTALPPDPSKNGLIGWRTAGSGSPGSEFAEHDVAKLGNQFYQWKSAP